MNNKTLIDKHKKKRYSELQLSKALDMIEEGYSHSQVIEDTVLNKSIIAREMRKRKNLKSRQIAKKYNEFLQEEIIELFEKYCNNDLK